MTHDLAFDAVKLQLATVAAVVVLLWAGERLLTRRNRRINTEPNAIIGKFHANASDDAFDILATERSRHKPDPRGAGYDSFDHGGETPPESIRQQRGRGYESFPGFGQDCLSSE